MQVTLHTKGTPLQAGTLRKLLNRKIAMKYKQEADELATTKKWRGIHKIVAESKGKPRKKAVSNFRLQTGRDCLTAHLRKIGTYESSAKYQTLPWTRNICCIALNSIPHSKCSRTPSNSTGMPERWWDNFYTICHRNNNNNNVVELCVVKPAIEVSWDAFEMNT